MRRRFERLAIDHCVARFADLAIRREEILRGIVERLARAAEPPCRQRQRLGREPERRKRVGAAAHPRALEARIDVARVGDERDAGRIERGHEPRLRHIEQRPEHGDTGPGAPLGDRRQAVETAAALEPHQEGLGLVVDCVGGDERRNVVGMAIGGHEIVARGAGSGLKTGGASPRICPR